jgi:rare lipoprotein A
MALLGLLCLDILGCSKETTHTLQGVASWYGYPHHGRLTASGRRFNMSELTAAHRTLPLGTRLRVTNLGNGRAVTVTITDRGPFVKRRVIDLSYAAAREIGMIGPGTAPVQLEILE